MKRFSQQDAQDYLVVIRYRMKAHHLRLGQAILNEHPDLCPCSEVYYCTDEKRVIDWFFANLVGEGEAKAPTDTSMVMNNEIRAQQRAARSNLLAKAKANSFGAIK